MGGQKLIWLAASDGAHYDKTPALVAYWPSFVFAIKHSLDRRIKQNLAALFLTKMTQRNEKKSQIEEEPK